MEPINQVSDGGLLNLLEGLTLPSTENSSTETVAQPGAGLEAHHPDQPLASPCPLYTWDRNSLTSDSSASSGSSSATEGTEPEDPEGNETSTFDDFNANGIECPLDAFDIYQCRLRERSAKERSLYWSTVCVFCKNNGENLSVYGSHSLKDINGQVVCPILQRYTCPICGASGLSAHTLKYCPYNYSYKYERTKNKKDCNDFNANGIECPLDAFDTYQCRLRERSALKSLYRSTVCVFCKNNGENLSVYGNHSLKDINGQVVCPILQRYTCPICGASGLSAHTLKYCPYNYSYKYERTKNKKDCNEEKKTEKRRDFWCLGGS